MISISPFGWLGCLFVTVSVVAGQATDIVRDPDADHSRTVEFNQRDTSLLDQIQRGCFNYLWSEVGSPGCLAKDRHDVAVSSVAAVGFQLSSLPIGVSMAALRAFRDLEVAGEPVWQDVSDGGFGFADSFNLDQGRVSWDITGIDCGPMLLAIENIRSGLIWRLFHQHPISVESVKRLRWELQTGPKRDDRP